MVAATLLLVVLGQDILPSQMLAIPAVGRGGRVPVQTDAIQYALAVGEWTTPSEGLKITSATGREFEWKAVRPNNESAYQEQALNGGYAYWAFEHPIEEIRILEAAGHSMVYVNGDPYSFGYVKLPIKLKQGKNELLFNVSRGTLVTRITARKSEAFFNPSDLTLPDAIDGETAQLIGGIVVVNAQDKFESDLQIVAGDRITRIQTIAPLTIRKVPFYFSPPARSDTQEFEFQAKLVKSGRILDEVTLKTRLRRRGESYKRTFISGIDGSVQYYAVRPATPLSEDFPSGIVLTAHGAGVEAIGQVDAYASKPWTHLVAPTNRRPYGFDWEDWGRLDALEVLEKAKAHLVHDPTRIYLTGHSMGGHGTWILGVTYPDLFAAIGPSAGWISFFTYAGGSELQPTSDVERVLKGATLPSDTVSLIRNLEPLGVYILHGENDESVPVSQARRMSGYLKEFHKSFEYHEQPGAGHWWDTNDEPGAACVDWPPMFDMFARRKLPAIDEQRNVRFVTASPGISPKNGPVEIMSLIKDGELGEIEVSFEPHKALITIKTKNVRSFAINAQVFSQHPYRTASASIDGQQISSIIPTTSGHYIFSRRNDEWSNLAEVPRSEKRPAAYGPFKVAFDKRFIYVIGTKGTPQENALMLAKARYDAETFCYRGNGSFDIVTDDQLQPSDMVGRNVILIGNETVNSAWADLMRNEEISIARSKLKFGEFSSSADDLATLFVRPHPRSATNLVAGIGFTGIKGLKTIERSPYFVSGASYPDWLILSSKCLLNGNSEIIGAGFFGYDWRISSGNFAWTQR